MVDNDIADSFFYLLRVYTGIRHGSGTKSNVGFVLVGEAGDTGIRILDDDSHVVRSFNQFIPISNSIILVIFFKVIRLTYLRNNMSPLNVFVLRLQMNEMHIIISLNALFKSLFVFL